jgi:hypothetical protein
MHDTAAVLVNAADGVVLGASAMGCPSISATTIRA